MSGAHHGQHGGDALAMHAAPGGLAISAAGYTLEVGPKALEAGREEAFEMRILNPEGRAVRDFDEQHEVRMHLIVVRRDLTYYQHLHPFLGADGTWLVPLTLPEPGVYRAFADFAIDGEPLTLGVDLTAPGAYRPEPLPAPTGAARTDDYEVTLEAGAVAAGTEAMLVFRISHGGQEVLDLEPYLGALGHLVVLREGDLAYLHVHPVDASGNADGDPGSRITFHARFPSMGRYRLFLQFAHEGLVHTASFTSEVPPGEAV
jgi:hypothetical protein